MSSPFAVNVPSRISITNNGGYAIGHITMSGSSTVVHTNRHTDDVSRTRTGGAGRGPSARAAAPPGGPSFVGVSAAPTHVDGGSDDDDDDDDDDGDYDGDVTIEGATDDHTVSRGGTTTTYTTTASTSGEPAAAPLSIHITNNRGFAIGSLSGGSVSSTRTSPGGNITTHTTTSTSSASGATASVPRTIHITNNRGFAIGSMSGGSVSYTRTDLGGSVTDHTAPSPGSAASICVPGRTLGLPASPAGGAPTFVHITSKGGFANGMIVHH